MRKHDYTVGKMVPAWNSGTAQTITFVVTEDCNLRCKYCYITHKNSKNKMNLDTAKEFIDYLLESNIKKLPAAIIEFIGGEPLIEVELIDQITDYFKLKTYKLNHEWYWNYRISICSNGMNYDDEKVQNFIKKNEGKLSLSISIDGIKKKHDLQRVTIYNEGSYDRIMEVVPLWLKQFPGATKVTFASQDLKYLKESIIDLWNRGITDVSSNVVFEDVWQENDDLLLEDQLKQLADYVLENKLYDKYYCTFFQDNIGGYYDKHDLNTTYCGAGKMLAIGPDGKLYPCIRYKDYSLNKQPEVTIGNVVQEIDMDRVRPFVLSTVLYQSDKECLNCPIATGCAFCQGFNYDISESGTNFNRAKYICKMHKARVKANDYYFSKLYNMYGIERESNGKIKNSLYILLSDNYVTYCQSNKKISTGKMISKNNLINSLVYSRNTFAVPILVHSSTEYDFDTFDLFTDNEFLEYGLKHIVPYKFWDDIPSKIHHDCTFVIGEENFPLDKHVIKKCIFNIDSKSINKLSEYIIQLFTISKNIKLNIQNIDKNFDLTAYKDQLIIIKDFLILHEREDVHFDVLTDILQKEEINGCYAGERSFTISPEGRIYVCAAYYSENSLTNSIGTIKEGITSLKDDRLYTLDYSPLCKICDSYQCARCHYLFKEGTNEINVPPSYLCKKEHIEREVSRQLVEGGYNSKKEIIEHDYLDPMEEFLKQVDISGFYKL